MWVMPTLNRPQQCAEVLRRIKESGCTSRGILVNNGEYYDWPMSDVMPRGWGVRYEEENLGCIGTLNKVFKLYPNEPWYGFIADDEFLLPESPHDWDQRLIAAAGDWKIAHGHENWNNGKRCQGYVVWGGKLVRAVGYWALPTTWHWFGLDSHWEWLQAPPTFGGGGLHNMVLVPEIKVEHNRAKPDLVLDECYKLADSRAEEDRQRFWEFCMNDLKPTAERVRKARAECNQ